MPPVLGYWDIRGLAQHIRYMLHYVGENYTEQFYQIGDAPDFNRESWLKVKPTLGLDFPNLPYYIDGNVKLTQSNAIARHVANKHGLMGKTATEKMNADLMENISMDMRMGIIPILYGSKENFETAKMGYLANLPGKLEELSKFLAKNGNEWMCGANITFPDFHTYEVLALLVTFQPSCLDKFANLKAYMKRFESLPKIKEYLSTEEFKKFPFNGKMAAWGGRKL